MRGFAKKERVIGRVRERERCALGIVKMKMNIRVFLIVCCCWLLLLLLGWNERKRKKE
jgi:hypothetical protein